MQRKNETRVDDIAFNEKIELLKKTASAVIEEISGLDKLPKTSVENGINFDEAIRDYEVLLIRRALEETGGSQRRAGSLLNLKHTTLNAKIKRFRIHIRSEVGTRKDT